MDIQTLSPVAGKDYPQTWNEFLDWFPTEVACLAFLERLRWPDGFVCPRRGCRGDAYRASRTRLTRFHGVFAPNSHHRVTITPARRG